MPTTIEHTIQRRECVGWMDYFFGSQPFEHIQLGGVEQGKTEGWRGKDELLWVDSGERRPKIIVVSPGSSTNSPTFIGRPKCRDHYKTRVSRECFPLGGREMWRWQPRGLWGCHHEEAARVGISSHGNLRISQSRPKMKYPPSYRNLGFVFTLCVPDILSYSLATSLHVQSSCLTPQWLYMSTILLIKPVQSQKVRGW